MKLEDYIIGVVPSIGGATPFGTIAKVVRTIRYKPISIYPFISRDIAVWVPNETESTKVYKVIKENTGDLIVKEPKLFDKFTKEDKTSYAYRMVFQSHDRTLSDEEVNGIMQKVYKAVEKQGWQVR